ncbi:MAG: L-threonylcarbamoyladenylate synthase [Candidatus Micrarchaeota archaeon]|nr:L-threonylcarbamoyladenylate synthase [Candidatus Micrarchaeota archaeon]
MPGIIKITTELDIAIEKTKKVILESGIIVYPTDTLYGIGGNALNAKVVERIYQIKRREERKPLSVIMANFDMIREYCEINKTQELILQTYLPGPFTFIVKVKGDFPAVSTDGTIGIRMPNYKFTKLLSLKCNVPIISTSANISGEKSPTEISELDREMLSSVDLIIDDGKTKYAEGSTIVNLVSNKIIRQGAGRINL